LHNNNSAVSGNNVKGQQVLIIPSGFSFHVS
jgi:hypothetical protein